MVKNSVLNSWTGIVIRIRAKIKWFVASETSHPPKIQNSTSTTSGIISKIRTVAPYHAAVKKLLDPYRGPKQVARWMTRPAGRIGLGQKIYKNTGRVGSRSRRKGQEVRWCRGRAGDCAETSDPAIGWRFITMTNRLAPCSNDKLIQCRNLVPLSKSKENCVSKAVRLFQSCTRLEIWGLEKKNF